MTPISAILEDEYLGRLGIFRLAYSRAGAMVSAVLVMMGVGLDLSFFPAQAVELGSARLLTTLLTLCVLAVLFSSRGLSWVRPLTLLWLSLPQLMIAWMIWRTGGADSMYFVGLHLALYATGIILPITFLENVGFSLFTYAVYFLACSLHASNDLLDGGFLGKSIFILFSGAVSSFCTYFNERGRNNLFRLQHEVSQKNQALERMNASLAEVKGQLIQQEKMAALGTLSAGLLHEINNPVNYGLMALNMAMAHPSAAKHPDLKDSLSDAREGMQRVQGIVGDLKTFAYQKPGDQVFRAFLFEKAVQSAMRLAGFELKGVKVQLDLPQDTHVLGDEPALIGVLINLLSNACVALRTAGKSDPCIMVCAAHRGGRLHVRLRDNGTGIAPEHLPRVFEPFFTTRDVGAGLGLGLSVSYGIVQRHGGTLTVASEVGQWSEFSFDLATPSPVGALG